MQDVDTLQESLGHLILQVGLHPDALTRRATPSELDRLHSLWAEFLRLLTPLLDSAFGKGTAPQLGFDYREGTLRDILCTHTSNSPCASQGLRWIRTLLYQLRALHRRHCTRTVLAVRAVFNRGLLEACQRHLRSAGPEVSAAYGQMLDELRRRTRVFLRHGTSSEEWISDAIANLTTKIAELAATDQRQRAASFQAYLKDALAEPGARRAHAMTRLEEPAQLHSFLPRGSLVDALHAAEATWHALWDVSGTPFDPTDLPTKINQSFEVSLFAK
jgi:hypothetical protein